VGVSSVEADSLQNPLSALLDFETIAGFLLINHHPSLYSATRLKCAGLR